MSEATSQTLPDQTANLLLALIFIGELKAGDKLPPERVLAQTLDIDRTSLRSAIRTLISMNLVKSVQGSGITVLNFKQNTDLTFIERLCQIDELVMSRDWIHSAFEFRITSVSSYLRAIANVPMSPQKEEGIRLIKHQIKLASEGAGAQKLAETEAQIQQYIASIGDNPLIILQANSIRHLNLRLMTIMYESINAKAYLKAQFKIVNKLLEGEISQENMEQDLKELFQKQKVKVVKRISLLPEKSYLISSPLKHKPNLLSLG